MWLRIDIDPTGHGFSWKSNHRPLSLKTFLNPKTKTNLLISDRCTTGIFKKSSQENTCACGFYLGKGLIWRFALNECLRSGARLPEIMNEEENAEIFKLMASFFYVNIFCIKTLQPATYKCGAWYEIFEMKFSKSYCIEIFKKIWKMVQHWKFQNSKNTYFLTCFLHF